MRRERKGKLFKGQADNTGEESAVRNTGEFMESRAGELRKRVGQHREGEGGRFTRRALQRQIEESTS